MVVKSKIEHINYALVAKTHTPMYLMHKYWARKPHNVVSEYIRHYSKEGDIVLDPFAGSGVTAIESIKLGRRAIAIDLDPMATFITKVTAMPVDLKIFEKEFKNIEKKIKEKVYKLYKTNCAKCKKEVIVEAVIWENDKPKEIRYSCNCSKGTQWKDVTTSDLKRLKDIENKTIPHWYPKNELIWNSRVNVRQGEKVYELFTKRNLLALSMILNEVEKVKNEKTRDLLKFTFTSALAQASKMLPYRQRLTTGGPAWVIRGFWIPAKRFELNVWDCFKNRYNKILRGKKESNDLIKTYKEAKNYDDLKDNANILIKTFNALELDKIIPPNSIDYVFTDPPYGDAVPYLELDYMWSSWLKLSPDFEDEIIISDSPIRDKNDEIYKRMLKAAFIQVYGVLKPGKYLTVTFHNTEIKVWNAIISSCVYAGFDLEKIVYQSPAHTSSKAGLAPYGSAVGDYYIRFKKPETTTQNNLEGMDEERYKRIIYYSARKIIADRGEPTPYTYILNGIIVYLKEEGALLIGKSNPDDVMKELLDKEFILVDAKDEKGEIIGKKWWFKNPYSVSCIGFVTLADRVEMAIVDVLRRKVKVSFDDVLQEIFIKFPNALTPETQNIKEILREYATPSKEGYWLLKPMVKVRESEHSEMIYYLAMIGRKSGWDVWIGQKEQREAYRKQKLSSLVNNKNPNWRFLPTMSLDRIKQIDVIWHHDGLVKFEFEVENTTAITEAIVRGSNIPDGLVNRLIVIPEEREGLLFRKMKEPMLNENVIKNNWKFIFYRDLKNFFEKNKRSKKIDLSNLEKLFRLPKEARPIQNSLDI
jgi:16S rRNA G966 N2-methylase RsmD